jgi:hypothetical protein
MVSIRARFEILISIIAILLVTLGSTPARASRTFIIKNSCNQTIWPGVFEQSLPAGTPQPMNGGWQLGPGQSTVLTLPDGFAGRFWARKNCTFDASGAGHCESGDCGNKLQCNGATGLAGTSLAEFTLWQPQNSSAFPEDWYDVSYVDGYDFPIKIQPSDPTYKAPSCTSDVIPNCPVGQQVKDAAGVVVYCQSACTRYGTDPSVPANVQQIYCCLPPYNNENMCSPANYPNPPGNINAQFKNACPDSYSWPDDDPTSVWHYPGNSSVTYTIEFCPNGIQTTGSGSGSTTGGTSIPATPTGVSATAGNGQATIAWLASSGATTYNIYRGTTSGGEGTTPIASGITSTSYTDTGLTNGTAYYYKVAAVNSAGTSGQSGEVSATPSAGSTSSYINCGGAASGIWAADVGFSGGTASSTTAAIDTSLAPYPAPTQAMLQTERDGNVTYTITGIAPGAARTVSLYFSENAYTSAGQRQFNVAINGVAKLTNFDIYANTGARYKAIEQSFAANADSSGNITIVLTSVKGNAEINGLAVY